MPAALSTRARIAALFPVSIFNSHQLRVLICLSRTGLSSANVFFLFRTRFAFIRELHDLLTTDLPIRILDLGSGGNGGVLFAVLQRQPD
jgi:hypothetical protein